MHIKLSSKLENYLYIKDIKEITIDYIKLKMCWARPYLPSVLTGKPSSNRNYVLYKHNGLCFYIDENLYTSKDLLKLDLRKFLFLNEIYVANHKA